MVEELSANVTELEANIEQQQQLHKAEVNGLEEKLQSTVDMATQKMRSLAQENSQLRAGKKK